jgi:hypothetical protein
MKRAVALVALATLAATARASFAVDSVEIRAQASGLISGVALADTQGPAGSDSLLASANWGPGQGFNDPTGSAVALAGQDVAGRSAVLVEAAPSAPNGDFQTAESRWTGSATHPGPVASEYVYEFFIDPPLLALRNACGIPLPATLAEYEITVKLDGRTIFQSIATLTGTASNPQLVETGTGLGGTFFNQPEAGTYGYEFSSYDGMLSLGRIQPGQTFHVETTLRVRTQIAEACTGAKANIGDPLDLGGDPGVFGEFFSVGVVGVETSGWSEVKALYRR